MAKQPDNAVPEPMTRWLNHGAEDYKINYRNTVTGRHGSTSFADRFRYRSAFEPVPVIEAAAAAAAAAEVEPLPVEPAPSGAPFDLASFVALLEAQRETTLALQGIAATLVELVAALVAGRAVAAPYPGQARLPFTIAPVTPPTAGANGAPSTRTNGAAGTGPG